jgi:arabinosyltransferase
MICKNTTICWWEGGNILGSFLTILEAANVTNYLIGVMDDETESYMRVGAGAHTAGKLLAFFLNFRLF